MHKVYNFDVYEKLLSTIKESSKTSIYEVCFDKRLRSASWICFMLTFWFQWTGFDALNIYSNRILTKMNENSSDVIVSAKFGAILLCLMNFVGSGLSYVTTNRIGRVKILVVGQVLMGTSLFIMSTCLLK